MPINMNDRVSFDIEDFLVDSQHFCNMLFKIDSLIYNKRNVFDKDFLTLCHNNDYKIIRGA